MLENREWGEEKEEHDETRRREGGWKLGKRKDGPRDPLRLLAKDWRPWRSTGRLAIPPRVSPSASPSLTCLPFSSGLPPATPRYHRFPRHLASSVIPWQPRNQQENNKKRKCHVQWKKAGQEHPVSAGSRRVHLDTSRYVPASTGYLCPAA